MARIESWSCDVCGAGPFEGDSESMDLSPGMIVESLPEGTAAVRMLDGHRFARRFDLCGCCVGELRTYMEGAIMQRKSIRASETGS